MICSSDYLIAATARRHNALPTDKLFHLLSNNEVFPDGHPVVVQNDDGEAGTLGETGSEYAFYIDVQTGKYFSGNDQLDGEHGNELWTKDYETGRVLRVPKMGIIGHVASTGDFVRTADVFTHQRFRMDSDLLVLRGKHGGEAAGTYRPTASPYDRAMMCGAIKDGHGKVIGVARVLAMTGR